jgi:putative transposase
MTKESKESREHEKKQDELIEQLVARTGFGREAILGRNGLVARLTRRVVEKALAGELTHHLGYSKGAEPPGENCRNGHSAKTVLSEDGPMQIAVPRNRAGSFEPLLIAKGQRRFEGFDEKIVAMYARGMSVREIQGFLLDQYKVEVSPDFISTVTDAVVEELSAWQNRPLETVYPMVFFDALRVKIRDEGVVRNKCVYLGPGGERRGEQRCFRPLDRAERRGALLVKGNERVKDARRGGRFNRGGGRVERISRSHHGGFPPNHGPDLHRASDALWAYCSWQDRRKVAGQLKNIYRAVSAEEARQRLAEFEESELGKEYQLIGPAWRRHWEEVIPFYSYPPEIRKMIYTTNAIESLHMRLRKNNQESRAFPTDQAAAKLIYLALRNIVKDWKVPALHWQAAMNQFAIVFGERFFAAGLVPQQKDKN